MIHTFQISYGLSLADANTCTNRLNEITKKFPGYRIKNFLKIEKKSGHLEFIVPELTGIKVIKLSKFEDSRGFICFRIYFLIEPEILRTGTDTLDMFFCCPKHAKELQTQYAKAIYHLFPEAFTGRAASLLYTSDIYDKSSYTKEEFDHSGLYSLPYLALGSLKRLDLTFDLISKDEDHARLLTEMISRSYYNGFMKIEQKGKNRNKESTEECHDTQYSNGSRAFNVYFKYDKMCAPEYKDRPNINQIKEDARNITRVELPFFVLNRFSLQSKTPLQVPHDAITLGPLPYLANEQIASDIFRKEYCERIGNFDGLKWYKRRIIYDRVNQRTKKHELKKNEGEKIKKIAKAIDKAGSLKAAIELIKAKKHVSGLPRSMTTLTKYRKLAVLNSMIIVPIPNDSKISELSALPSLRKINWGDVTDQIRTRMLPYQSVADTAPDIKPIELYDDILSYLYNLYDEYVSTWNNIWEEALIPVTDENREKYGL